MKRIALIVISLLSLLPIFSQEGAPLLSYIKEIREVEDQNWAICQDDNGIMMFAHRRGIGTYDGQAWGSIDELPVIPYSMVYNAAEERVFVGSDDNYGYLARNELGEYEYYSLSGDSAATGRITSIIFTETDVYFCSDQTYSRHDLATGQLELRQASERGRPFTGLFTAGQHTYVNVWSEGLYRIDSDTLFPVITGYKVANVQILFSLPYDEKLVLLGLSDGYMTLFDGVKFFYYTVKDNGYLKQNILSEGITLTDSLYVFSTMGGGVVVVEKNSRKVKMTINYDNGLPDDEIFALGSDRADGIWMSHQGGLTRADLMLPVGNFSIYPGLEGSLVSSLYNKNRLYVATSEGVYYLDRNYIETEVLVKNPRKIERPLQTAPLNPQLNKPVSEMPQAKKGVLSKIFTRKDDNEVDAAAKTAENKVSGQTPSREAGETSQGDEYLWKRIRKLSQIPYVFTKVKGLDAKCRQIVTAGNEILAVTVRGLYSIKDDKATAIDTDNRNVNFVSSISPDNSYWIALSDGFLYLTYTNGEWVVHNPDPLHLVNLPLFSIAVIDNETIWAGGDNAAYRIRLPEKGQNPTYKPYRISSEYPQRYYVDNVNDTLFVFTESGMFFYDPVADLLTEYRKDLTEKREVRYYSNQPDAPWIRIEDEWYFLRSDINISGYDRSALKIFDGIIAISTDEKYIWIVNDKNQLFRLGRNQISAYKPDFELYVRSIRNDEGTRFRVTGEIEFGRGEYNITFDLIAPDYLKEGSMQYQYTTDRNRDDWSVWTPNSQIPVLIRPGSTTISFRARDLWGNISQPHSITFTSKRPFTRTSFFYIMISLVFLSIVFVIVWFRERQLQKEKKVLEEKVLERTAKIEAQKREITSSIEYAGRIQMAMLPSEELYKDLFSDYFVLFKPRDIVSGDFYWIGEDQERIFFTVADCTGHGVPGAFMSTLGISTLYEIINNRKNLHANTVLNLLREKIKKSLHQTGKVGEAADGMDVAFCILYKNKQLLEYAGAFNPLVIIQNNEIKEYKGDRMPIGIYVGEKNSFTNYEINIQSGDTIYIFSDGYIDQFGGPEGSKYKKASLKKLLLDIHSLPMKRQKDLIEAEFERWRGDSQQVDDITILGIRV